MTLNERLYNLETLLKCKIIYLNGFLTSSSIGQLLDTIIVNHCCSPNNYLLILRSKGGNNVYEDHSSIREMLNRILKGKKLWILINKEVASAGTVLASSADRLFYLDTDCQIGPIDPQIIEKNESFIKDGTEIQLDWGTTKIVSSNLVNEEGIKTIEATMRSFINGQIIDYNNRDQALKYLMNINNDFRGHADRKKINELPDYLKKSLIDINNLVGKVLIEEIIKELDLKWYDKNYYMHSI